jgi:aminoglycoside phosphotransferase (APT) family kinase protein
MVDQRAPPQSAIDFQTPTANWRGDNKADEKMLKTDRNRMALRREIDWLTTLHSVDAPSRTPPQRNHKNRRIRPNTAKKRRFENTPWARAGIIQKVQCYQPYISTRYSHSNGCLETPHLLRLLEVNHVERFGTP